MSIDIREVGIMMNVIEDLYLNIYILFAVIPQIHHIKYIA
jgi:hypothetical protein